MIRKSDVQWWVLEARKKPESAPEIIQELAQRLLELDEENERLRDELVRQQQRAAPTAPRSSEVQALQRQVETLQSLLDGEQTPQACLVLLSERLQSARLPLSQARQMAQDGQLVMDKQAMLGLWGLLLAQPHQELLLLTSQERGLKATLADAPLLTPEGNWPTGEGQGLTAGERLTAAAVVGEPPRFWTVATRRGYVQRFVRAAFDRQLAQGMPVVRTPLRNDVPVALVNGDRGDVLLVTRWGQAVRFSQRIIESQGSIALTLDADDEIVAALALPKDAEILIVTASGYAVRRDMAQLAARSRPGGAGKALINAHDVLAVFPYLAPAWLVYLTYSGQLIFVSTADIPQQERLSKGFKTHDLRYDPAVAVALAPESER